MATEKLTFSITWDGPGNPTLEQLLDNSEVISLAELKRESNRVFLTYSAEAAPLHHLEWVFTFIGEALSNLKATVVEDGDATVWPLDHADSAKHHWNSEGSV